MHGLTAVLALAVLAVRGCRRGRDKTSKLFRRVSIQLERMLQSIHFCPVQGMCPHTSYRTTLP
ncbi:hypothetical protein [Streptomyces sp. NPDC059349]|uniref:hypothetical protein n=1 Tax=Streptomyces sp. NPDC059349 TaxID=3346808 RepID=UPI0036B7398B